MIGFLHDIPIDCSLYFKRFPRVLSMTSNSTPVYRHGRKLYVSSDEYEYLRAEQRRERRQAMQNSSLLPMTKSVSTLLSNPLPRYRSNLNEYKTGIVRTSHSPVNTNINTVYRREPSKPTRSILKARDEHDELSSSVSMGTSRRPSDSVRSQSWDKLLEYRRASPIVLPLDTDDASTNSIIQRSSSAHIMTPTVLTTKPVVSRRAVPTSVADYGMSPLSNISMTSNDHPYSQSNPSKTTTCFLRMKSPHRTRGLKPAALSYSALETDMPGTDYSVAMISSSNQCADDRRASSASLRSTSNNVRHEHSSHHHANHSFSPEDTTSSLILSQSQNMDTIPYQRSNDIHEHTGHEDSWTRPNSRHLLSNMSLEKKRVRFADMEGFNLETMPGKMTAQTPRTASLLQRRKTMQITNSLRGQARPVFSTFYQAISSVGGGLNTRRSKLATDV
jgi:hypothetical protein